MHSSLRTLTARLTPETRLYPGHEYTEMLLKMAVQREPANEFAKLKLRQAQTARARREPTLPSTMKEELEYNAHLRASPSELAQMCGCCIDE
jgi:hydroxyacylglutathione hydrolase